MPCRTPYITKDRATVPCGRCPECVARRVSGWSFRLRQEQLSSNSSYFITLTYDVDNVPITRNGFMDLNKVHLQQFFKRLRSIHTRRGGNEAIDKIVRVNGISFRSRLEPKPIKYYAVGEYGGVGKRPHYHIILLNAKLEWIADAWKVDGKKSSKMIGDIHYGYDCSAAAIGYCLKYISKPWTPMHKNDDRSPQFALQSTGLGKDYLTPARIKWHQSDLLNRVCCTLPDGKKLAMPRYYKDRIYTHDERLQIKAHGTSMAIDEEFSNLYEVGEGGELLYKEDYFHERAQTDIYDFMVMKMKYQTLTSKH